MLYQYPKQAHFGRVLPKSKIYQHGSATNGSSNKSISSAIKQLFIDQVDQIKWAYKLAPNTLNIPPTEEIPEIQVFRLRLKEEQLSVKVLATIDKAISFPIIYELERKNPNNPEQIQVKMCATYKAAKIDEEQGKSALITQDSYLSSDWQHELLEEREPLPMALNLASLYEQLLTPLIPQPKRDGESFTELVERAQAILSAEKQLEQVQNKLIREKQFNRKVALNQNVRDLTQNIAQLTGNR